MESALNELKLMRQGNKKMIVFGQELREVARRAEIYSDRMLIGYLKAAVNPEMTRAIIYRGPQTYVQALNICVEIETELLNNLADRTFYTSAYANTTPEMATQNYQKPNNIRCFRCKKVGHMKRDCRVGRGYERSDKSINSQTSQPLNREVMVLSNFEITTPVLGSLEVCTLPLMGVAHSHPQLLYQTAKFSISIRLSTVSMLSRDTKHDSISNIISKQIHSFPSSDTISLPSSSPC